MPPTGTDAQEIEARSEPRETPVALLECDPELAEGLSEQAEAQARTRVLVDVRRYPRGDWRVEVSEFDEQTSIGLLIIDGLMTRAVTVADYTCAELLGPGDVLQPWLRIGPDHSVAAEVNWRVVEPTRMAVLDRSFIDSLSEWPQITSAVSRRIMNRLHWLAFHLAVCGLRRIEDRALLVLWHFADRWGTMTGEGVRLDVPLTHDLLAAVIGARRPSVTVALTRLREQGRVRATPRSHWLLLGEPPDELRDLHQRTR